ncbi:MAG: hypothetical protein PHE56_06950 [Bacteroidales bacterium]|jgi:hypothetical protein|nr:hypothetical protein [Bacteroidales bacterium]
MISYGEFSKRQQLTLTQDDISVLNKKRKFPLIVLTISAVIFTFLILVVPHSEFLTRVIVVISFDAMMAIPAYIIYLRFKKDVDAGFKYCVRGKVQTKNATTGKNRITYVVVNNEKFVVSEKEYQSIEEGDEVEAHFSAHTRNTLLFRKI